MSTTEQLNGYIISPCELKDAIAYALSKKVNGSEIEENAKALAEYFLNFFGYSDRIIDNVLLPSDRNNFYDMEDEGILGTDREEVNLIKGPVWRIKYWVLNKRNIIEFAKAYNKLKNSPPEEDPAAVYLSNEITEEMWKRERASNEAE